MLTPNTEIITFRSMYYKPGTYYKQVPLDVRLIIVTGTRACMQLHNICIYYYYNFLLIICVAITASLYISLSIIVHIKINWI